MSRTSWEQPAPLNLSNQGDVEQFVQDMSVQSVVDPYDLIVDDLYKLKHPDSIDDITRKSRFAQEMNNERDYYGEWFYFPWKSSLVRYPNRDDHFNLRTMRNRNLITDEEQQRYRRVGAVFCGLSIGSNVVESLIQSGTGDRVLLADFDIVSPSNLNRMSATMADVGLPKTTFVGRRVSEVDPYIDQIHLPNGYDESTIAVLREFKPDVIVEEMDDFGAKVRARDDARQLRVPVFMAGDIGEKAIIDVERYDLDAETEPFHGRIPPEILEKLRNGEPLSDSERQKVPIRVNRPRNLSPRLVKSALEIGNTISGYPQLGTTARVGGALTAVAIQEAIIGRKMETGSYVHNTRRTLRGQRLTSVSETIKIAKKVLNANKK